MNEHTIAGRMSGETGTVTFCECGLAFFARYPGNGKETPTNHRIAIEQADGKWQRHTVREELST